MDVIVLSFKIRLFIQFILSWLGQQRSTGKWSDHLQFSNDCRWDDKHTHTDSCSKFLVSFPASSVQKRAGGGGGTMEEEEETVEEVKMKSCSKIVYVFEESDSNVV